MATNSFNNGEYGLDYNTRLGYGTDQGWLLQQEINNRKGENPFSSRRCALRTRASPHRTERLDAPRSTTDPLHLCLPPCLSSLQHLRQVFAIQLERTRRRSQPVRSPGQLHDATRPATNGRHAALGAGCPVSACATRADAAAAGNAAALGARCACIVLNSRAVWAGWTTPRHTRVSPTVRCPLCVGAPAAAAAAATEAAAAAAAAGSSRGHRGGRRSSGHTVQGRGWPDRALVQSWRVRHSHPEVHLAQRAEQRRWRLGSRRFASSRRRCCGRHGSALQPGR